MSLIPLLYSDPLTFWRPSRILDQQFGLGLDPEDLIAPVTAPDLRTLARRCPYFRPWLTTASKSDVGSTVNLDKDKLQINLDVQHFTPDEISVKAGDGTITIEGKHEEKEDKHGFVSRHFVRRYVLPKGHDVAKIQSELSSDGVLTITAPRTDQKEIEQRTIPISKTAKPSKAVENKKGDDKKSKK